MFLDLSWTEMLVIGTVALVVIGPKQLPGALRTAGYWVRKARGLSREFQGSVEQMIREAELDEVRKDLKKATEFDLESEFRKTVDPTGDLAESIKLPPIPDYFDETGAKPPPVGEGSPVAVPPPVMIGFDEPATVEGTPAQPDGKPDEFAASKA